MRQKAILLHTIIDFSQLGIHKKLRLIALSVKSSINWPHSSAQNYFVIITREGSRSLRQTPLLLRKVKNNKCTKTHGGTQRWQIASSACRPLAYHFPIHFFSSASCRVSQLAHTARWCIGRRICTNAQCVLPNAFWLAVIDQILSKVSWCVCVDKLKKQSLYCIQNALGFIA